MADEFAAFRFPVLLGDIGGTNARFALLHAPDAEPVNFPNVATADYPNIDDAIRAVVLETGGARPRSVILAIAAPVNGEEIALTNCHWVIRPQRLIGDLGFEDVVLLNDFEAQSLAISALPESGYARVGGGTALREAGRVVVGPGTGLGVGALVRTRGIWVPVPGEGGHIDLGPRTERDRAIWPHLQPIAGRISAEQVLSGRGLVNLYHAICGADGLEPLHGGPAAITKAAIARTDPVAGEAVDLFATYLARVAGDLALVFMARGGVFIAGGIFARILPVLREREMRAAFEDKAPHSALLAQIPLCVITQPLAALVGLAALARNPSAYGLETQGRHWSRA